MGKIKILVLGLVGLCCSISCKDAKRKVGTKAQVTIDSLLEIRYQKLLEFPLDSTGFPRSYNPSSDKLRTVPSKDWTSGFFPGNLWHLYELTSNPKFKERAAEWTAFIEKEKINDGTHDMGFKVFCSFGEGLKINGSPAYKDIIVQSARTLASRFNENVGCLRSWDFNKDVWEFPVIIDNMMNLELLFEATKISGDSTYHHMAVSHANTTLKHHYRDDNSTYHVVVYDTINGAVLDKVTHQGLRDDSSWARGQAWGIYGYTMAYRYTKDPAYLSQARASATFYLEHPNLREDGIPYWDFDDPKIPESVRDVSAATIVASAFYELAQYDDHPRYIAYADKVIAQLLSREYLLGPNVEAPFILKHSTGHWPKKDEMDEPIVYGDYYFLEALIRQRTK